MPFEEIILQYGAIGACLIYFMIDQIKFRPVITKAIDNNTIAMTKVYEVMNHCKNRGKKNI